MHNIAMKTKEQIYIFSVFLLIAVIFSLICIGTIFPTVLEIHNVNNNLTASVTKRSFETYFNKETKTIDNVKYCSIYEKEPVKTKFSKTYSFNVIIFSSDEKSALFIQEYNNSHDAKILKKKIDNAIYNKKEFKYTIFYYEYIFIGLFPIIFIFIFLVVGNDGFGNKHKKTNKEIEKEQTDNINDSIIK